MKFLARIALLFVSAYLAACASYFPVPNQRFDSPTVGGKMWKGNIGGGLTNPTYVQTVNNTDASPPLSSGSKITRDPDEFNFFDNVVVDVRVGLGERFEISNVADMTHLKFQFLGDSRMVHTPNQWVGSVTVDYLTISKNDGTDGNADFSVDGDGIGTSVIIGYRTESPWIYYVNLNYLDFNATTDIDQHPGKFKYDGDGRQVGAALGARFEKEQGFYMAGEWAYSKTNWSGTKESELGSFGGVLGWAW